MKNKKLVIVLAVVAVGVVWFKKKDKLARASSLTSFGFRADDFGRPATIDGHTGILV